MSRKGQKNIPAWAASGHARPVTRRDFLSHGLIPFAAATFMPSWFRLFGHNPAAFAQSASCPTASSSMIPFIQLNLSGGAALMANYVPMDAGGQPLPSYSKMGLGDGQVPLVREFGNATFAGISNGVSLSPLLDGIRSQASANTMGSTAFISFCVRSRDDSNENLFGMAGMAQKSGLLGAKFPNMGNARAISGVNQKPAVVTPSSPLVVGNFTDIANSLGYTAALGTQLNQAQKEKLSKLVSDLNAGQARKLASVTNGAGVQNLIECAGIKNVALVKEGTTAVDPRLNATFAPIWGLNANSGTTGEAMVFASMVYNGLMGYSGAIGLEKGGYDYHGQTRAQTNAKDRDAGVVIGRVLQSAAILGKPVFLAVTSDGAVSSDDSMARDSQFNSDRGSAGLAFAFMYSPTGRPATSAFQVGSFTAGQAADDKHVIGNNPEMAAQAIFANYLKFNNKLDLFQSVASRTFDLSLLNQLVKVA